MNLATDTTLNAKINEVKNKIPNIINLAATTALTAVENKTPNVYNLANKTAKNGKYITTHKFNKLTSKRFIARLTQANFASKSHNSNFVNKADFDNRQKHVISNKNELNELSKKFKQYQQKN